MVQRMNAESTPDAFLASLGYHSSPGVDRITREIESSRPQTAGSSGRRRAFTPSPNAVPVARACRSGLMIRLVSEVKEARFGLDLVLDEAHGMDADCRAAMDENRRLKATVPLTLFLTLAHPLSNVV